MMKNSSFIIHHSSLEHAIIEFQRVKRQLLPIHPSLAAAKVQRCFEVAKGLCTKVLYVPRNAVPAGSFPGTAFRHTRGWFPGIAFRGTSSWFPGTAFRGTGGSPGASVVAVFTQPDGASLRLFVKTIIKWTWQNADKSISFTFRTGFDIRYSIFDILYQLSVIRYRAFRLKYVKMVSPFPSKPTHDSRFTTHVLHIQEKKFHHWHKTRKTRGAVYRLLSQITTQPCISRRSQWTSPIKTRSFFVLMLPKF